jgi:hypothetical protein
LERNGDRCVRAVDPAGLHVDRLTAIKVLSLAARTPYSQSSA